MDLNGDGDIADFVCHVHDSSSAATTNTFLASAFDIFASVDIIAILVRESHQGNADLNGDGDTADDVIHVYEPCTGAVTNLGLSVPFSGASIFLDGPIAAFTASEAAIGLDLNGDGDAVDRVPHVFDARTGTLDNISVSGDVVGLSATSVVLVLGEASNDNTDFNGDGDVADSVALIYDAHTGLLSNTGLAVPTFFDTIETSTLFLTIIVPEASQGSTDLNRDGDALDSVLHLYNLRTQAVFNTSLSARAVLGDRLVALTVHESDQGNTDLNGDGDIDDIVLYALDPRSLLIHNLGVSSTGDTTVSGLFFTFQTSESSEGDTDLNGDGDTFDDVYHVYDSRLRVTRNLGIATRPPQGDRALLSPSFAAFVDSRAC
jgi:hypothetical protein